MRPLKNERGQELAELGFTLILFMLLSLGIVEFGRMLMIVNMVTQAARHGARIASVVPAKDRTAGTINTATRDQIIAEVQNQIANVTAVAFTVNVTQTPNGSIPMVQVNVTGTIPYLFAPLLFGGTASVNVNRTVNFRDDTLS